MLFIGNRFSYKFFNVIPCELYAPGRSMSRSKGRHYEGAQGATGTASVPEVAVQCRRNLSSLMVTTQHMGRRNISYTTCVDPSPLSFGLHLCPLTLFLLLFAHLFPCSSPAVTHTAVYPLDAVLNDYRSIANTQTFVV